jgi:AGZA family xanthine/uracil permease-like MFS transporter
MSTAAPASPRWFTPGDIDGFLGLFFGGFPVILLLVGLAPVAGLPAELVAGRILPGVAVSVLVGNLFYAWQARRLAAKTGRRDVTAIPFGVNTPTIFAYVYLIMAPVYARTHDVNTTWQAGVFASLLSGVFQTASAFCMDWLRRMTPRAALLCPLAGLALSYLCLSFVFGVFYAAAIALLPMIILFSLYGAQLRLPYRLPAGLVAMGVGAALVALMRGLHIYNAPLVPVPALALHLPQLFNVFGLFSHREWWAWVSIILPLSLLDTLGSLQILESVKVGGDDYRTMPSLLMNGLATIGAACFGSPFPTSLYLGHTALKASGARIGYSVLNGLVILVLCLTGLVPVVLRVVPLEVAGVVLVWYGLVTVGQAFTEVPAKQSVAVALGLLPMLAQWATGIVAASVHAAGATLPDAMARFGNELAIRGLFALGQGALLSSMVWAAMLALSIERRFAQAALWMVAGAGLSAIGMIHAYTLSPEGISNRIGWWVGPEFTFVYLAGAAFLLICEGYARISRQSARN